MNEASGLALRVLGGIQATREGEPLDLGGRRQRAVLAALVIARGEAVSGERLADCVWGDDQPANPAGALQSYISHLRRRLEPEAGARHRDGVIARAGNGYILRVGADAVDAWRFERTVESSATLPASEAAKALEQGLRLWSGPAYAEYAGEPWAESEIARLTELRAVARERLLEARLSLGESALLIPALETLVAEEPLREERWRLLVLALYRAQRQADALAALRRARNTLADALGVDPGPALRALETEVFAQAPHLDPPLVGARASTTTRSANADEPPEADLVDRDHERAVLRRAIGDVIDGGCSVLLLEGPAGIGKTRLLAEATRLAAAGGVAVLSARCSQPERAFGFGVVRQLFESRVRDPARQDALLTGAAASAGGVFDLVPDPQLEGEFSVLHGLYWLTVNLTAAGPVMLAVDDVQWGDPASLRFLAYLVKRLPGLPVVVVMTLRSGEPLPDDALLADVALDPMTETVRPRPLSEHAARRLVEERLGEAADAFVGACHRTTSGNPLLLRQLLRALESEGVRPDVSHTDTVRAVGSRAVTSLVMLRLRRAPADVLAAARAVAVLGHHADLPTVATLAGLEENRAARALDILCRSEVLRSDQPLVFVHPLVRDAVYEDLPSHERALHHEKAAAILRQRGATPEEVALHLVESPHRGDPSTVAVLRAAAQRSADRGAADSAVVFLRRALDEPVPAGRERTAVLLELGDVESHVDGPASAAHLCEAYEHLDDARARAEVAIVIARTHLFASPPGVATAFARDAAAALPAGLDDARQGLLALQRTAGYIHGLPPSSYRAGPEPTVAGDGDGARMLAATLAYEQTLDGVDRKRAVELARFALEEDRIFAVDNGLLWVMAANVLLLADARLGDFWERALSRAQTTGSVFAVMAVNIWRGFTQWRRGQLGDAVQSLADADEQQRMWGGSAVSGVYIAAFTAGVHIDRGDLGAAQRAVEGARPFPEVGEGTRLLREAAARLFVKQGRPAAALDELAAVADPLGVVNPVWTAWRTLKAAALALLGRHDMAIALVEEEVELLRRWGAASALGRATRILGELSGDPAGLPHLREAVDRLAKTDAVLELARAQLALARCAAVPDAEAVALLREAAASAARCGARRLKQDASAALAVRGEPTEPVGEAAAALSGRERRVLELIGAGLEIHEVAQQLFLTPSTVRTLLEAATERTGA